MAINDGGAAFPSAVAVSPQGDVFGSGYFDYGMSLRDWLAGQAIAGLLADGANLRRLAEANRDVAETTARSAYAIADAMLKAREAK